MSSKKTSDSMTRSSVRNGYEIAKQRVSSTQQTTAVTSTVGQTITTSRTEGTISVRLVPVVSRQRTPGTSD